MPKRTDAQVGSFAPEYRRIKSEREQGVTRDQEDWLCFWERVLYSRQEDGFYPWVTDEKILAKIAAIINSG